MGRREDWTAPTSHPHGALQECPHYRLLSSTCRSVTRHQRPCRRRAWSHPCPSATLSTTVTSSHSKKHFASLHKEVVGVDSFHWLFPVVWVPTSGTLGLEGGSRNSYNIDSSWRLPWWSRLHAPNAGDLDSIPGQETRSHMPQLRVHMLWLMILHAATKIEEPMCCSWDPVQPNKWVLDIGSSCIAKIQDSKLS